MKSGGSLLHIISGSLWFQCLGCCFRPPSDRTRKNEQTPLDKTNNGSVALMRNLCALLFYKVLVGTRPQEVVDSTKLYVLIVDRLSRVFGMLVIAKCQL